MDVVGHNQAQFFEVRFNFMTCLPFSYGTKRFGTYQDESKSPKTDWKCHKVQFWRTQPRRTGDQEGAPVAGSG